MSVKEYDRYNMRALLGGFWRDIVLSLQRMQEGGI